MAALPLADLQEAFARAMLDGAPAELLAAIEGDSAEAKRQVDLYRRAVHFAIARALRAAHPVVLRLVGDAFFDEAARCHAVASPPAAGDLNRYGAGFADFLAAYGPASDLPWLADVARLEWAMHESGLAADAPPFDAAALAAVPAGSEESVRLAPHPSLRLVRSRWPVLAVWEANQPGRDGTPDRTEGADDVMVWRDGGLVVRARLIDAHQARFVEGLLAGQTLGDAAGEGDWDLPGFLRDLVATAAIAGPPGR